TKLTDGTKLTDQQRATFEAEVQAAEKAKSLAATAVSRDIAKQITTSRQQLDIQKLALSGREEEAAVLDALTQAQEKYKSLTIDERDAIEDNTRALYRQNEALQIARDRAEAYLDANHQIRNEVEAILA